MPTEITADYVVVGSGAGGAPLAARLAEAGHQVLLLEAGGDPLDLNDRRTAFNYSVPALHGQATEDPNLRWDYFVRHYADDARQGRDSKKVDRPDGPHVLYPRAAALGGCTAHNPMIVVAPHNSDWDGIALLTGDDSWRAERMRDYFVRLERCGYLPRPADPGADPTRHGFDGWLTTGTVDPSLAVRDDELLKLIASAAIETLAEQLLGDSGDPRDVLSRLLADSELVRQVLARHPLNPVAALAEALAPQLDPNDWRVAQARREGVFNVPLSIAGGSRNGPREFLVTTRDRFPDRLRIESFALAARVLFRDGDPDNTAVGVEYLKGRRLYRADPRAADGPAETVHALARREVILCAGAFNTPQLLMLSGVGPAAELNRLGIPIRADLPGVGRNLQDRYEVGVVSEMRGDFSIFADCTFRAPAEGEQPDPCLQEWIASKDGAYATNGAVLGIVRRSTADKPDPDLFIFGLAGLFRGYFPGYADAIEATHNRFTWAILKGHTSNAAGTVTLRSTDPRDPAEINFRYFDEGDDLNGDDLQAVVEGVKFVRRLMSHPDLAAKVTKTELLPSGDVNDDDAIREFVKNEAWGHHACGTCKMGVDDDPLAVLDSRFRVRGTKQLRVVDASIFPRIPGFFIATPIYMVSEKAADVILAASSQ